MVTKAHQFPTKYKYPCSSKIFPINDVNQFNKRIILIYFLMSLFFTYITYEVFFIIFIIQTNKLNIEREIGKGIMKSKVKMNIIKKQQWK